MKTQPTKGTTHTPGPVFQEIARMIAAAPDLLAALRGFCVNIGQYHHDTMTAEYGDFETHTKEEPNCSYCADIARGFLAIAKADGK